jgi:signal transduction histidine kinase
MYSPAGSTIEVSLVQEGDSYVLAVEDEGPGIPREVRERVFDKFFRIQGTKSGGTGLGLSIAKGFVQAHHGSIRVEERDVRGSRFVLTIPIGNGGSHSLLEFA